MVNADIELAEEVLSYSQDRIVLSAIRKTQGTDEGVSARPDKPSHLKQQLDRVPEPDAPFDVVADRAPILPVSARAGFALPAILRIRC